LSGVNRTELAKVAHRTIVFGAKNGPGRTEEAFGAQIRRVTEAVRGAVPTA